MHTLKRTSLAVLSSFLLPASLLAEGPTGAAGSGSGSTINTPGLDASANPSGAGAPGDVSAPGATETMGETSASTAPAKSDRLTRRTRRAKTSPSRRSKAAEPTVTPSETPSAAPGSAGMGDPMGTPGAGTGTGTGAPGSAQ